jgi:hypothetical protein
MEVLLYEFFATVYTSFNCTFCCKEPFFLEKHKYSYTYLLTYDSLPSSSLLCLSYQIHKEKEDYKNGKKMLVKNHDQTEITATNR